MAKVSCSDGEVELPDDFVQKSRLLRDILEDCDEGVIPIQNISMRAMNNLLRGSVDLSRDELVEMALAADFLAHDDLLNECCKQIARNISGLTREQIMKYLGIDHLPSFQQSNTKDPETNEDHSS